MSTVGQIEKTDPAARRRAVPRAARLRLSRQLDRPRGQPQHRAGAAARLAARSRAYDDALIDRALCTSSSKAAGDTSKSLYDRNRDVYDLLRYGVKVQGRRRREHRDGLADRLEAPGEQPLRHRRGGHGRGGRRQGSTKRPDVVLYVNGIALGVLELKRSTVSVSEGIRQNLDNQKKDFIQPFFSTVQLRHGRQRHRGSALRRHRDAGEVLPDLEGRRARHRATRSTAR